MSCSPPCADVAVTDNALTTAVSELRTGTRGRSGRPTYIQTVAVAATLHRPRRGPPRTTAFPAREIEHERNIDESPLIAFSTSRKHRGPESLLASSGIAETVTNDLRAAGTQPNRRPRACRGSVPPGRYGAVALLGRAPPRSCRGRQLPACRGPPSDHCPCRRGGYRRRACRRQGDGALERCSTSGAIVAQFADALGTAGLVPLSPPTHRETSSLEAYQAFTEGRVARVARRVARGRSDRRIRTSRHHPRSPVCACARGARECAVWQY